VNEITLEELYDMQKALDARIIKEKGLEGQDLLPNTVLALQVEIAELANEWRGFKHWSNDREPRTKVGYGLVRPGEWRNPLLEEYVDCLHFFLSIARQIGLSADDLYVWNPDRELQGETSVLFSELMHAVARIGADYYAPKPSITRVQRFRVALYLFHSLGEQRLGFKWDQIAAAYVTKNEVNHKRQENGY